MSEINLLSAVGWATGALGQARKTRDTAIAAALAAGHTQSKIGEAAGLSPSAIRKIASGVDLCADEDES